MCPFRLSISQVNQQIRRLKELEEAQERLKTVFYSNLFDKKAAVGPAQDVLLENMDNDNRDFSYVSTLSNHLFFLKPNFSLCY